MGYGDRLMAIGDAKFAHENDNPKGLLIAIGDGENCDYDALAEGLPFLATPEQVARGVPVKWLINHGSNRPYINYEEMAKRLAEAGFAGLKRKHLVGMLGFYIWNHDYKAKPGVVAFSPAQRKIIDEWSREPFVVVEPFIKRKAPVNKQWPISRFGEVIKRLAKHVKVVQLSSPENREDFTGAIRVPTQSFKDAIAYVAASKLYVGPEGGLHHAAAAVGKPAVVTFGGFIAPQITGYDTHTNLVGNAEYACGTKTGRCDHCMSALDSISVEEVVDNAMRILSAG